MSKLRDKFHDAMYSEIFVNESDYPDGFQYADDAMIKFAKWLRDYNYDGFKSDTELLQIFKDKYYEN
jgi:hypothetical protein